MNLFIDAPFLCHRSHCALGSIKRGKKRVEVLFGVLREVSMLIKRYEPEAVVWCFDSRFSLRKKVYPQYKANRIHNGEKSVLYRQMDRLQKRQLKMFGFRNVIRRSGYEADDIIAQLCRTLHFADEAVIVSADGDLRQCLRRNIRIYNPSKKSEETIEDFTASTGRRFAQDWGRVKALTGCASDNVEGIPGVGEKTAWKFIKGELKPGLRMYEKIMDNLEIVNRNTQLVVLPYTGLENEQFKIQKDHLTFGKWKAVLDHYGLQNVPYPGTHTDGEKIEKGQ